jgi:sulfur-oxidizing protein SoxX
MLKTALCVLLIPALGFAGCATSPDAASTAKRAEQMVLEAHPVTGPELNRRTRQDASQQACSAPGAEKRLQEQAAAIVKTARESVKYPASGKLAGDWQIGAALVADGRGQRIVDGKIEALKENGALCINCHAMDAQEVNAGNLGPPLVGYGRQRGNSEAVARYTYERIYNAWAFVPCSNMPRLGANGFLTPEQIAHVVAYLMDPQSPVNRLE